MEKEIEELRDLTNQLEDLKKRKDDIKKKALEHRDTITDAELDSTNEQLGQLVSEIKECELKIADAQERAKKINKEERKEEIKMENQDKYSTLEYRQAFMNYVARGEKNPILETRADAATTTTTAATVIPTTIVNEIIKKQAVSGNVLGKVRKLNIRGGVQFPTISVLPTASWVTESKVSDRKALTTGSITFSYYELEVRIAQSLLSEYTSIDAFENEFVTLAVEAMTNAKEIAIFNGSGSGQPTGILKTSSVPTSSITAANFVKWDKLVAAISPLKTAYRAGAEWFMAQETFDALVGAVDTVGQPIARVNYGLGTIARSLLGFPVNIVEEDRVKGLTAATAGTDFIAVLGNMKYYAINSNGNLGVRKYTDEDANQVVTKAYEILDGKVLDVNAFLCIKKASA